MKGWRVENKEEQRGWSTHLGDLETWWNTIDDTAYGTTVTFTKGSNSKVLPKAVCRS
jgi:hypothetical protein